MEDEKKEEEQEGEQEEEEQEEEETLPSCTLRTPRAADCRVSVAFTATCGA